MNDLDILGEIQDNLPVLTKPEDGEVVYKNIFDDSKYVSALNFFSKKCFYIFCIFFKTLSIFQFDGSRCGEDCVEKSQSFNSSDTLCFESRFESGNLAKAVKM